MTRPPQRRRLTITITISATTIAAVVLWLTEGPSPSPSPPTTGPDLPRAVLVVVLSAATSIPGGHSARCDHNEQTGDWRTAEHAAEPYELVIVDDRDAGRFRITVYTRERDRILHAVFERERGAGMLGPYNQTVPEAVPNAARVERLP